MMTPKARLLREWIGRTCLIHNRLCSYEQAAGGLEGACGSDKILMERDRLREQENVARMELYELLSQADLTPRQFTILNLHYLQYLSWTQIAQRLFIERRYALQVHIQAIERLALQLDTQPPPKTNKSQPDKTMCCMAENA